MTLAAHVSDSIHVPLLHVARIWEHVPSAIVGKRRAPEPTMPRPNGVRYTVAALRASDGYQAAREVRAYRDARHVERREREAVMSEAGWMIPGVAA